MGFSPPTQTQTTQLSPAQQQYQSTAANWLTGQVGQPGPGYTGQLTAGLSPQQGQAIGEQGALGQFAAGPEATGFNTLGNIAGGSQIFDPVLGGMLASEAAYAQNQFRNQVPYFTAPFQEHGQTGYSTPAQQYLTGQIGQFETGLASTLGQQAEQNYQQALNRQQQAASQVIPLGAAVGQQGLQALSMPQQTQQAALTNQYNEWLRQFVQSPWQAATGLPSLAGQPQGATVTQTGGGGPFSLLGPLAQLAKVFF